MCDRNPEISTLCNCYFGFFFYVFVSQKSVWRKIWLALSSISTLWIGEKCKSQKPILVILDRRFLSFKIDVYKIETCLGYYVDIFYYQVAVDR